MSELNFDIEITRNCNFHCKYCLENGFKSDKNNFIDPDKLLYKLENIIKLNKYSHRIGFWGGEATLNEYLCKLLFNNLRKYPNTYFNIYTNGSNIDPYIDLFKSLTDDNKLKLQLSYDGNPIHDMNRLFKNNQPTSNLVLSTVKKLCDNKIPFTFKSTLPLKNISDIYDCYLDIININKQYNPIQALCYSPTIDFNDINYKPIEKELTKFKDGLLNIVKYELTMPFNYFRLLCLEDKSLSCSAGCNMFGIDIYGNVYPCHGCIYVPDNIKTQLKFFNILDNNVNIEELLINISEMFSSFIYDIPNECNECHSKFDNNFLCHKCNISSFMISNKTGFKSKWMDLNNKKVICDLYKIINEIRNVYFYAFANYWR